MGANYVIIRHLQKLKKNQKISNIFFCKTAKIGCQNIIAPWQVRQLLPKYFFLKLTKIGKNNNCLRPNSKNQGIFYSKNKKANFKIKKKGHFLGQVTKFFLPKAFLMKNCTSYFLDHISCI